MREHFKTATHEQLPHIGMCGKPAGRSADAGNAHGTKACGGKSGPCGA